MKSKLRPDRKYKSKLYQLRLGATCRLKEYEYGVSHISKRLGRKFIQRKTGKGFVAMRVK